MNVIVILLDTLRRDHLGCYHGLARTPSLDAFAERSVVFDNAYVGSYPCMPARRDIWTGRYEFPRRGWGALEPGDLDFPGLLRAAGRTAMLVTDHYHLWERGSGNYHFNFAGTEFIRGQENDGWITDPNVQVVYPAESSKLAGHARGGAWARYQRNASRRRGERDYGIARVVTESMDWLDANHGTRDFCLFVDAFDPHEPFDPPESYWQIYNPGYEGEQVIWPSYGKADYLTPDELRQVRALYAGKVTLVDRWVGYLLDHIERLGLLENSLVMVTTDHGHMLGEHGIIGKPWSGLSDSNLYQELSCIPLLLYLPGIRPQRSGALVQLVDLYPTILAANGVPAPDCHGIDLLPIAQGGMRDGHRYACFGRFGEAMTITDGTWTLMQWPEGADNGPLYWYSYTPPSYGVGKQIRHVGRLEDGPRFGVDVARGGQAAALYHLGEDTAQARNLSRENPDELRRLRSALAEWLGKVGAPREQLERLSLVPA
ncbi:MAG: sulfatase [Chloroflexota bacterium]